MSMDAKRRLLSFLTVTALCLASVGAPPPAAAKINPPISVEVQSAQAGACTAYRLNFATTSALAKGDTITVTFPQGTILQRTYLPADLIKVNDVPVGKVGDLLQPNGNRLTIPVPEGFGSSTGADYAVFVDIGWDTTYGHAACITNPAVGAYTIQVSTSKDGAVTSGSYEISTSWRFKFGWDSFVGVAELYYGDLPTVESPQAPPGVWYAATDLRPFSPTRVDKVTVPVTSSSDPAGLRLTLTETGVNTGIFYSPLFFTTGPSDRTRGYLHVQDGNTLSASGPPTDPSLTATATWQAATDQSIQVWANIDPRHDLGDDTQFALIDQESGEVVSCTVPPLNYYDDTTWNWCPRGPGRWDFISSLYHPSTQAVALSLPLDQRGTYVIVAHREGYAALSQPFSLPDPVQGKPSYTPASYEAWTTILPPMVLTEDQEPPATPTVNGGDEVWSNGFTLKLAGQAEAHSDVHINGDLFGSRWGYWTSSSGNWSYETVLEEPAPEGTNTVEITARDLALNVSKPRTIQIIVDRTALPPSVDSVFADSTSVTGLGEPGAQIRITRDGKLLGTGTADNSGHFRVAIAPPLGHALLEVRQTDRVGNVSEPTIVEVHLLTIPVPTVFQVRPGDKEITGVTQPGLSVEVYKGTTLLGQTRGTADGRWGVAIPAQKEGAQLQVRVTDLLDPANAPALVYIAVTAKQSNTPAGPPPAVVPPVSGSSTGSSTTVTTTTGQEGATTPSPGGSGSSHRPPPPPPKPKGDGVELLPDGRTRLTKMLTVGDRPEAMVADLRGALVDQCQVILPIPLLQKAAAVGGTLRLLTDGGSLTISARSLVQAAGEQKLIALTLDRVRPTLPPGGPSAAGPALFIQVKDGYGRPIAIGALADPATLTLGSEGASAGAVWHWVEATGAWIPLTAPIDHGTILLTKLGFFLPVKP